MKKREFIVYKQSNGFEEKYDCYSRFENALNKAINVQLVDVWDKVFIECHTWIEEDEVMTEDLGTKILYEAKQYD